MNLNFIFSTLHWLDNSIIHQRIWLQKPLWVISWFWLIAPLDEAVVMVSITLSPFVRLITEQLLLLIKLSEKGLLIDPTWKCDNLILGKRVEGAPYQHG